jgi:AraC-like DNA-binding protein
MAQFIASHSSEPITVADVALAVHLHPGYAMTAFRRLVGTTIGSYLTQCRVAHAQRLLITSPLPVQEIGLRAGFQSVSQFYDRFSGACGTTPGAYRRAHARAAPPSLGRETAEFGMSARERPAANHPLPSGPVTSPATSGTLDG